ncbi:phage regulatory CII family protein [Vibrio sp. SCSIO 43136]|uniref:phage regulatory CII family protein n=1 Tax=Vibrio sp. SCSIO 43136 TaxID=2819101 RepID=UPI0020758DA6|nr:phage regulatory CII family protein [Vibrio sp. SCSIO 43136]
MRFKKANSVRALALRLGYSEREYENRVKAKFTINRTEERMNVADLVGFTKASRDYSMVYGICSEVGLTQPVPVDLNANTNLNTEFLVAAKAFGQLAEQLNMPTISQNGVVRLTQSVQALVASAMTIGYAAENRFGGLSMAVTFGDIAVGTVI